MLKPIVGKTTTSLWCARYGYRLDFGELSPEQLGIDVRADVREQPGPRAPSRRLPISIGR